MSHAAIFLDRDGTVIAERHYLKDPALVELLPGAAEALRRLQEAGYLLFFVTNQSGIGRGYFTLHDALRVQARVEELLAAHGVRLTHTFLAPEAPDQPSRGRKPSPAFLWDARDQFGVDLARSYLVGDKLIDLECGWNAGVRRSLLVCTGYGRDTLAQAAERLREAVVVPDLAAAADWILAQT